jgi:rhodanese-related sulfurtransferase
MDNTQDKAQEAKNNIQDKAQAATDKAQDVKESVQDKAKEVTATAKDATQNAATKADKASGKIEDAIAGAKDKLPNVTPTPAGFQTQSSAQDLKSRLEWGEPALTIIDVRDREAFNHGRIMGAIAFPADELVDRAKASLESNRDIYVYGDTDQESAAAASQLRSAGFERVAEIKGGLADWKAIGGPTEGIDETGNLGPGEFNVASRLKVQGEIQATADQQDSTK